MNIKVKEARPLNDLKLDVLFTNGIHKIYDVKKAMSYYEPFKELEDNPYLFKQAKVDCGGCAVCWNEDIDVTEWELWEMGETVQPVEKISNIHFNRNGQGRMGTKITLPLSWIESMGFDENNKEACLIFDGNSISIKSKNLMRL